MAAPLNTCTTIEQRGVVRFLWAKIMDAAKDIHKEMLPIWVASLPKLVCISPLPHNVDVPPSHSLFDKQFGSLSCSIFQSSPLPCYLIYLK
jgi:hypothetical protein